MQDVAYADSYTATRIAAAIAEPSSGRHLRYVTVMDPGYNQGGVPTMRRYDLGSRYETPSREASTHLYPEAPITAAPATPAAPAAAVYGTAAYANPVYTTASHATPVYPSAAYTNPSYRTVVRASADNIEGELRSELSILRHQIYELRKRSRPLEEDRFLPAFSAPQSDPSPSLDFLKKEFSTLHQENRQLKDHLDQLRDQLAVLSARGPPEERRPEPKFPVPAAPPVTRRERPAPRDEAPPLPREEARPLLGVELKQRGELLLVHRVVPRGPCDFAGVRGGDILRRWDNHALTSKEQLDQLLDQTAPGTAVRLIVQRYGRAWPLTLVIGGQKSPPRGRLGAAGAGTYAPAWPEVPKRRFSLTSTGTGTASRSTSRGTSSSPGRRRRYYSNPALEDDERCQF
eukprot:EG_transcript_9830